MTSAFAETHKKDFSMQEMTVIDWLKAYRASSPIYTADAFACLDTAMLGASMRLLGASIALQDEQYAVETTIDLLSAALGIAASKNGLPQFIIKAGNSSASGKAWSVLIKRMDMTIDAEASALEMTEPRIEASLLKNEAPDPEGLIDIWEAARATHPFLLRLTDEEIGAIADPVRRSLIGRVDVENLINMTTSIVFLILAFEYTSSSNAVSYITDLENAGQNLGDWAFFLTEDGNFAPLVSELEMSLANRTA